MELDPQAAAAGVRLIVRDSVGSTNDECLALARAGETGPLWIVARRQKTGRGRRGRTWASPPGNLYSSLLLVDACQTRHAAQLSFIAALALADALIELLPAFESRLALKWPNDVLLDGQKVAGILVEGETLASRRFAAVIGIGVNCASHPPGTSYPATALAAQGIEAAPAQIFAALSYTMRGRLAQWERGENFAAIREAWLSRAAWKGEAIVVRGASDIEGIFTGVDDEGSIVLRLPGGESSAFAAGELARPLARASEGSPA